MATVALPHVPPGEQRKELPRAVLALVRSNNEFEQRIKAAELAMAMSDFELPDVGTPGTYGGDGDFVESVTVDAEGRTTAVVVARPASTAGSVMSMVGPAGAAAPVVAYDFTQLDPALTSAQNLAAANQSGNSAYDLISDDGTDILVYSALGGDQRQMVPHAMPFCARADGGGLLTAGNGVTTQFARTNGSPAGLRLQAGFTGEILMAVVTLDATNQFHCFSYVGGGGNAQYFLLWDTTGTAWKYLHQHGAAVTDALTLHTTSAAAETNQILQHFTLTRSADMSRVRLYRNGRLVGAGAPITSGLPPDGGAGAELRIGQAVGSRMCVLAARFFDLELTAAQVRASYQRTFFGVET